jgi:hypothetical protein
MGRTGGRTFTCNTRRPMAAIDGNKHIDIGETGSKDFNNYTSKALTRQVPMTCQPYERAAHCSQETFFVCNQQILYKRIQWHV